MSFYDFLPIRITWTGSWGRPFARLSLFAVSGTIHRLGRRPKIKSAMLLFGIQCCRYPPRAKIVSTIAEWLTSLGLCEYTDRFDENGIDISVQPDLTDQDLKDLGVLLGHRRKMLRAIRDLGNASVAVRHRHRWRLSQFREAMPSVAS
jgi:hypothetical protein